MDIFIGALLAFAWLYLLERLLPALVGWARPLIAVAFALGIGLAWGAQGREYLVWAAAGAAGLVLSEVVSIIQAATDTLRVRVISAATRRGGRIPPI